MKLKLMSLIIILTAAACGRNDDPLTSPPKPPKPVEIQEPEEIVVPEYSYGGASYRSPFSPQALRRREGTEKGVPPKLEDLNLDALTVTGVISDNRSKYAILSGPGAYYIVRDGRLLDQDDKQVSGVAAVVSEDEVTLITKDEETIKLQVPEW